LAEDDIDDVLVFELALKKLNITYQLRHADNGDVLFVLLKDRVPYILFLDIHMPCKDGVSCIVDIRKNRDYDKLPIVMYTSNLSDKIIDECFRNGANLYLAKTSTFAELTKKLEKVFAIDWTDYLHYPPQHQFVLS
jgi:CheY-like chemotaxis protein